MLKHITLYSSTTVLEGETVTGYGLILKYAQSIKEQQGIQTSCSVNQMELKAVIEGLKLLKEPCEVTIITDAIYVVKGINIWLEKWQQRDFQKVMNLDLWRDYLKVSATHNITAQRVADYIRYPELARCSALAIQSVEKMSKSKNL